MKSRRSKYRNKLVKDGGETFGSKAEHRRWMELKLLEKAREITNLKAHPRFPIVVNGVKICTYVADACYRTKDGMDVVEDVKGAKTAVYSMKRDLMLAVYGITITEVPA